MVRKITFEGRKYPSVISLLRAYGVHSGTFYALYNRYGDVKKAIELGQVERRSNNSVDHLGNKYSSITEMAKAYGLNYSTVNNRLNYGWSIEKVLTTPARKYNKVKFKEQEK